MTEHTYQVVSVSFLDRQRLVSFYKSNREKIKIHKSDLCYILEGTVLEETGLGDAVFENTERHQIRAAVKFTKLPDGSWLLRNMLVAQAHRQQGLGHRLLKGLAEQMSVLAKQDGITEPRLYCFPWSNLTDFYCQHGFCEHRIDDSTSTSANLTSTMSAELSLSSEVIARFKAYRKRGLDIRFCYWGRS